MGFTHLNAQGHACMVDVSAKTDSERMATARGVIHMEPSTLQAIKDGAIKKGDVLAVAQVAGIMGAKSTSSIIPMCHPLFLTAVDINFEIDEENSSVIAVACAKTTGKTGVEMEALTAVSVTLLTIYDMCKAVDRWMEITDIGLLEKQGGKSGHVIKPQSQTV